MQKNTKFFASILAVIVLIGVIITSVWLLSSGVLAKADGSITLIVVDQQEEVIFQKEVKYYEGDSFRDILERNLNLTLQESEFGTMITGIQNIMQGDGYWWVYVRNGEYTVTGMDLQEFADEDIFTFTLTYFG